MESPAETSPGGPAVGSGASAAGDAVRIAASLGQQYGAGAAAGATGGPPPVNKGGRRAFAEELASYCQRHNLRVVGAMEGQPGADLPPADESGGPGEPAGGYGVDPAFVSSLAKSAAEAVEAWRQRAVFLKALAILGDKALAKEISDGAGAPPGVIETLAQCCGELARKYALLGAWAPEVALLTAVGIWVAHDLGTWKRLEALAASRPASGEARP